MTHGSLFSGIGGFDLAAQWMGWQNIFHCEWNEFGQRVLKHYWPKAITYHDITKTDFTIHRGTIDVLTGGFPCQPYSMAGKRLGKEDERHLWPEMLRAIREIQPRWIVGENVFGLVNWSGGLVFHEVQTDLEAEGYEVQTYVLPACAVNAPHRRDRVWIVAYMQGTRCRQASTIDQWQEREQDNGSGVWVNAYADGRVSDVTHTNGIGLRRQDYRIGDTKFLGQNSTSSNWENFPIVSPICDGDDGLSSRLDGITFPRWRNESIKAGGNAVVPQVALQIFKTIAEYERVK